MEEVVAGINSVSDADTCKFQTFPETQQLSRSFGSEASAANDTFTVQFSRFQ